MIRLGVAVVVAVGVPLGLWLYLCSVYSTMLTNATTPWILHSPVGEIVLYLLFKMGTLLRRVFPSVIRKGMQAEARAKADLLARHPPRPHGICFIGSSTFTYWRNIVDDFKELGDAVDVFNSGFGGSCTGDITPNIEALCTAYKPAIVVYFCGTNNITQGLSASSVLQGFELFSKEYLKSCPNGHIVYLSITRTPFYHSWNINNCMDKTDLADGLVDQFCKKPENVRNHTFVNTANIAGLDEATDTSSRVQESSLFLLNPDYYLGDNHHLTDEGHQMLAQKILLPVIYNVLSLNKCGPKN